MAGMISLVNDERGAAGLPPLQASSELADVAARHSARMASSGDLHHNPNLSGEVTNWQRLTENVGQGPDVRTVHEALMVSSSHAANVLDANVSQIGVGITWAGGDMWVTQVFRQPTGGSTPPPAPAPQTAPEPPPPPPPAEEPLAPPAPPEPPDPEAPRTAAHEDSATPSPTPTLSHPASDPAPAPEVTVSPAVAEAPSLSPDTSARLLAAVRLAAVLWVLVE